MCCDPCLPSPLKGGMISSFFFVLNPYRGLLSPIFHMIFLCASIKSTQFAFDSNPHLQLCFNCFICDFRASLLIGMGMTKHFLHVGQWYSTCQKGFDERRINYILHKCLAYGIENDYLCSVVQIILQLLEILSFSKLKVKRVFFWILYMPDARKIIRLVGRKMYALRITRLSFFRLIVWLYILYGFVL